MLRSHQSDKQAKTVSAASDDSFLKEEKHPGNSPSLLLSLLLHILVISFLFLQPEAKKEPPQRTLKLRLKQESPNSQKRQIVETEVKNEIEPLDSLFLAEKNSSTKKQTIKRGDGAAKKKAQIKKAEQKIKKPKKRKTAPRKTKPKEFDLSLNSKKLSEQFSSANDSSKAQASKEVSSSNSKLESINSPGQSDFLPSIPDGEITFLNAKANAYAVFVRRVALQVFGALRKHSWSSLGRRDLAEARSSTTIRATLSAKGKLLKIEQLSSSGSTGFDAVVKRASQEGAWDHNPPTGALAGDGNIYFIFKSRSWSRPGAGPQRERRWILLSTGLL